MFKALGVGPLSKSQLESPLDRATTFSYYRQIVSSTKIHIGQESNRAKVDLFTQEATTSTSAMTLSTSCHRQKSHSPPTGMVSKPGSDRTTDARN